MPQSVTQYFREEHQEIARLLSKLNNDLQGLPLVRDFPDTCERLQKLSRGISQLLRRHLEEEEEIIYPALEARVQGIQMTLDRMRSEHVAGEKAEQAFLDSVESLGKSDNNRREVLESGRRYITWVRGHLLKETAGLFSLIDREFDSETQEEIRRTLEERWQKPAPQVAEALVEQQARA